MQNLLSSLIIASVIVSSATPGLTLPVKTSRKRSNNDGCGYPNFAGELPDKDMRNSMLMFAISKGCHYLAGFIKTEFTNDYNDHPDHHYFDKHSVRSCDWQAMVKDICNKYSVPDIGCEHLISCSVQTSMFALGVPLSSLDNCQDTQTPEQSTDFGLTHGLGKRHNSRLAPNIALQNIDSETLAKSKSLRNIHVGRSVNISVHGNGHSHGCHTGWQSLSADDQPDLQAPSSDHGPEAPSSQNNQRTNEPSVSFDDPHLSHWCRKFSRNIKRKYHFSEYAFVRRSAYWIFDVYSAAKRFHLPKSYAHGLVGCGMNYALSAMNASRMQTHYYKLTWQ